MLPYVNSYKPDFYKEGQGFQIANRVKSALLMGPQLATGVADIALIVFCFVPAMVSILIDKKNVFTQAADHSLDAINITLSEVFESAIHTLNPQAFQFRSNEKSAFFLTNEPLSKYAKHLAEQEIWVDDEQENFQVAEKNSFLRKHVASRLVAIASIVTVTAAVALDLLSAPVLVGASLLTLGRVNKLNEYATTSLKLWPVLFLPLVLFIRIVDPSIGPKK